jgi:hypothetical protein
MIVVVAPQFLTSRISSVRKKRVGIALLLEAVSGRIENLWVEAKLSELWLMRKDGEFRGQYFFPTGYFCAIAGYLYPLLPVLSILLLRFPFAPCQHNAALLLKPQIPVSEHGLAHGCARPFLRQGILNINKLPSF